jgi:hypothetical protein
MARLYADEDIPRPLVEHLRRLGHDILTALEAGQANQSIKDPNVFTHATSLGRAVLTHNRKDFKRLHQAMPEHAGPAGLATRIDSELAANSDLAGKHIRVNKPS